MVYSSSNSEVAILVWFWCWLWILLGCGFFFPSEKLWRVTYSTYVINQSLMGWGKSAIFYQLKKSLVNQLLLWQPARHLGTFLLGSLRSHSCYCFMSLYLALAEEKRSAQCNQLAWPFGGLLWSIVNDIYHTASMKRPAWGNNFLKYEDLINLFERIFF